MNKDRLIERKKLCEEVSNLLDGVSLLIGNLESKDIVSTNKWLYDVIRFYDNLGIKLSVDDFKIPDVITDADRTNKVIETYMNVLFNNMDNLDSKEFLNAMFITLKDDLELVGLSENVPVFNDVHMGVVSVHCKHKDMFKRILKEINSKMKILGYEEVTFRNIKESKIKINNEIDRCNNELALISLEEEHKKKVKDDVVAICMILTNGKYLEMGNQEKLRLYNKLPKIMQIIVRYRVFSNIKMEYIEYSYNNRYDRLLNTYYCKEDVRTRLQKKYNNNLITISKTNSKLLRSVIEKCNLYLQSRILINYNDTNKMVGMYLDDFYKKYLIDEDSYEFKLMGMDKKNKLFGSFDFDKIPIYDEVINRMDEFSEFDLRIPGVETDEFKRLSNLALNLIGNSPSFTRVKKK